MMTIISSIIAWIAKSGLGLLFKKFILPWFQDMDAKAFAEKIGMNKTQGIVFSGLLVLVLFFATRSNGVADIRAQLELAQHNMIAMADSVSFEKNKAGELEAVKLSLVTDVENLKLYSEELAAELEKERGKVSNLTASLASISRDTVYITNTVSVDTSSPGILNYTLSWEDSERFLRSSRFLEGKTFVSIVDGIVKDNSTVITRDELNLYLVQGIRVNDKGQYETFIRSDYDGINFNTQSAVLDAPKEPRTKKWGVGVGVGYDFINQGPAVNVGVQRNFIRF